MIKENIQKIVEGKDLEQQEARDTMKEIMSVLPHRLRSEHS